jgi:REP element-mobilizing transposase RayT
MNAQQLTGSQVSAPAPQVSQVSTPAQQLIKHPQDHCRNYLPHIENKKYQMITFRLNDSVPRHVVEQWKETLNHLTGSQVGPQVSAPAAAGQQVSAPAATGSQVSELAKNTDSQVSNFATTNSPFRTHQQEIHRLLKLIDQYEDAGIGECLLRDDSIAQIVQDTLLFNHQKKYELICWCIMPNHVHTLIAPVEGMSLSEIMYDWKSYTTHTINKALNRKGKLWMMEYFDRYIRDNDHFQKVVNYIHNNPVKAGLVADPADWRWSSARSYLGSQVGSQVSVPASTTAPAPTGSQVSAPAPTDPRVSTPAPTEAVSSSAGAEICRPIDSNPLSAGRETCEPTPNEKQ